MVIANPQQQPRPVQCYPMYVNGIFWKLYGPTDELPPEKLDYPVDDGQKAIFLRHKAFFSSNDGRYPEVTFVTRFVYYGLMDPHVSIGPARDLVWSLDLLPWPVDDGRYHHVIGNVAWKKVSDEPHD